MTEIFRQEAIDTPPKKVSAFELIAEYKDRKFENNYAQSSIIFDFGYAVDTQGGIKKMVENYGISYSDEEISNLERYSQKWIHKGVLKSEEKSALTIFVRRCAVGRFLSDVGRYQPSLVRLGEKLFSGFIVDLAEEVPRSNRGLNSIVVERLTRARRMFLRGLEVQGGQIIAENGERKVIINPTDAKTDFNGLLMDNRELATKNIFGEQIKSKFLPDCIKGIVKILKSPCEIDNIWYDTILLLVSGKCEIACIGQAEKIGTLENIFDDISIKRKRDIEMNRIPKRNRRFYGR